MTSSGASQPSDPGSNRRNAASLATLILFLAAIVSAAAWYCFRNGWILYYGDAESHLNISRALIDSRTPGYDQLGTVWLPVLHVICLPFVGNDRLWSTGLAGTIPVAACFVVAGMCFYLAAREAFGSLAAAWTVAACFALNPNVLYLSVIPMTEVVFLAALSLTLLAILRFRKSQRSRWVVIGALASWILCLTRYDGWFLVPFAALWVAAFARRRRLLLFAAFACAASLAPLYWIAHNWWETGRPLNFYNGPYSAIAIQGPRSYPGYHDWLAALHYYGTAGQLCAGTALVLLAVTGVVVADRSRAYPPLLFLALTPLFYIWSMHSSGGTPIYVPSLWPHSYYNSRYGIALVPLCAFSAGAIVPRIPFRWRHWWPIISLVAVSPWLLHPSRQNWICWKESEVNSVDRRAWTGAAAEFLGAKYNGGQGILTSSGDVTGIYRRAGIHLTETLNIGNGPSWFLATTRPDLFHPSLWSIVQEGDALSKALARTSAPYRQVRSITTSQYSPALHILKRTGP